MAFGTTHACSLSSGGMKCVGNNSHGQLGTEQANISSSTTPLVPYGLGSGAWAVGAGGTHTCAYLQDGTVKCFGYQGTGFTASLIPVSLGELP
jgi:hypothetical protein